MLKQTSRLCIDPVREAYPTMIGSLRPFMRNFVRLVGPHYLQLFEGVKGVERLGEDHYRGALDAFYRGDERLIIAFRHVMKEDAPALMYTLMNTPPVQGHRPHAHFLYGKDVLNWAGRKAAMVFPHLAAVPVENHVINSESLRTLKDLVINGEHPIALAPEAQVTYHTGRVAPISHGSAFLAHLAAQEHRKVSVLPVSLYYTFDGGYQQTLQDIFQRWETRCGLTLSQKTDTGSALLEATEKTLTLLCEEFPCELPRELSLRKRLQLMCQSVLDAGESLAGLSGGSRVIDRVFALRKSGNNILWNKDVKQRHGSPLSSRLLEMEALKGHLILRHERVADILEYIDPTYITETNDPHRECEYGLNLLDLINRMEGGTINTRYSPKGKQVSVLFGERIPLQASPDLTRKEQIQRFSQNIHTSLSSISYAHEQIMRTGTCTDP